MKLLSTYLKEMKIASRGFYFYIEIFIALLLLAILLLAVEENPDGKGSEYLYYDLPEEVLDYIIDKDVAAGKIRVVDDKEFTMKPVSFSVTNRDTGDIDAYEFTEEDIVTAKTVEKLNTDTGKVKTTAYVFDEEEDALRMSVLEGDIAATTIMNEQGVFSYKYFIQGYEAERFLNVLYVLHTFTTEEVEDQLDQQVVREIGVSERMNNRERVVPAFVVFAGSLMGFFIIMSYIYLDKDEGVIKAFGVTPSAVWKYLLSKTFVIVTTVIISSTIIVVPVLKLRPDYFIFYVFLILTTFAFSTLGLLVASLFDSISKAFGVLYIIMILFMVPGFSYYISSFDPLWIRFLPTYPVLQAFKGILVGQTDMAYVGIYSLVFLLGGILLLAIANARFKKTLTV